MKTNKDYGDVVEEGFDGGSGIWQKMGHLLVGLL